MRTEGSAKLKEGPAAYLRGVVKCARSVTIVCHQNQKVEGIVVICL